jgi:argininosuccinate synthase
MNLFSSAAPRTNHDAQLDPDPDSRPTPLIRSPERKEHHVAVAGPVWVVTFQEENMADKIRKVVLAYSGGLDTSVILHWIRERYQAEVIAFTADIGQGEEVEEARAKALRTGASKAYAVDLTDEFVSRFVFPVLRAGAVYESYYLLGTSFARPLIARKMIEIAQAEGADAVAHGATGKGNDQVRFEISAYALKPDIRVIAPWREWSLRGREDCIAYAREHGIAVPVTKEKPYSTDANLFHISYEGGVLEDPWTAPPQGMWKLTTDPESAPDEGQVVEVEYEGGDPVAIDGERLAPAPLLRRANEIAGRHGVGRVDIVENRFVGMKSRGCYETPGGTLLHHAHKAVESLTLDRQVVQLRDDLIPRYAAAVYNGFWYAPERLALQGLIDDIQKPVSGTARVRLYKGSVTVLGRKSPNSLYRQDVVTFEEDEVYHQGDADGFIKLNALRLRIARQLGLSPVDGAAGSSVEGTRPDAAKLEKAGR